MGLPFRIIPPRINEEAEEAGDPRNFAETLAVRKVKNVLELLKGKNPAWVCGADTLISVDGAVFGKAATRDDAKRMIETLQGRSHQVITAVALYSGKANATDCRSVVSDVAFCPLSEKQIEWYLDTGEWQGVAGSYRIQGLASCFISGIRGSYSSIAGLPLHEFYVMLRENGYPYGA
jgi:septum formation protein